MNQGDIVALTGLGVFLLIIIISMIFPELGKRLDHGNIRKSIAISFTVMYIFMLAFYFWDVYTPLVSANTTLLSENFNKGTFNETALEVPIAAITDIYKNFLYVYIIIIIFYFGSRAIEGFTDAEKIKSMTVNDRMAILKTRLAKGEITKEQFDELKNVVEVK
jgi:uncharacterized membrane protein